MKKAREGRAKLLFCFIKYAKFLRCRCRRVVDLKLSIVLTATASPQNNIITTNFSEC